MILLSLNIRGVGGPLQLASLKRLLEKTRPPVVLLQETLVDSRKSRNFMNFLRPDWLVCTVSAVGTSSGLLATWDSTMFELSPVLSLGGIFLTGMCLETKRKLAILNTYGPCKERRQFWEKLDNVGILATKDLILAGDLNFMTIAEEIWGENARSDPLGDLAWKGYQSDLTDSMW
jgi:hypothetical protein